MNNDVNKHKKVQITQQNLRKRRNIEGTSAVYLTGSLLKNTRDALVRINQRFFHDVHPIPVYRRFNMQCFISKVKCDQPWKVTKWGSQASKLKRNITIWHRKRDSINKLFKILKQRKENTEFMQYHTYLQESIPFDESSKCPLLRTCTRRIFINYHCPLKFPYKDMEKTTRYISLFLLSIMTNNSILCNNKISFQSLSL